MTQQELVAVPETVVMTASEVREHWSQLVLKVFHGDVRVVVEKSGLPVVAIISAEDLERLKHYEREYGSGS